MQDQIIHVVRVGMHGIFTERAERLGGQRWLGRRGPAAQAVLILPAPKHRHSQVVPAQRIK